MENIDAYKEILAVIEKHNALLKDDYKIDIKSELTSRISLQEISKEIVPASDKIA